ncbi:MAG: entry exclusion protein TrbK [Hyphomicrobiales bacterium]|nr:MAG: entry exclusion protein TrbK [Hyphomicrobiales bacterium]
MVNRLTIFLTVTGLLVAGAAATILISLSSGDGANATVENPAPASPDAERRRRAGQFFGGDPDRDVRGGQEMKPRW